VPRHAAARQIGLPWLDVRAYERRVLLTLTAMLVGLVGAMSFGLAQPGLSAARSTPRSSSAVAASAHTSKKAHARQAAHSQARPAHAESSTSPASKLPGLPGGPVASGGRPRTAASLYMTSVGTAVADRLGCAEGRNLRGSGASAALVVLDFGGPAKVGWRFGVSLFGHGFRTVTRVRDSGVAYARAYARCLGRRPGPTLRVALGTSNYGRSVGFAHGRAWAQMVNNANDALVEAGLADRVDIAGADDIETSWSSPAAARAWVRGYDSVAEHAYYDYGDAGGCPPAGSCLGRWTQEDVWYVSWGARAAWPLPEIYTPNGAQARQWAQLSLYAARHHGSPITIVGALSQRRACRQSTDPCRGMNATPDRAWKVLRSALGRNGRTRQGLSFSTDIRWTGHP
jgi:hypothetical protein